MKFCWWYHWLKLLYQNLTPELLLDAADHNPYWVIISLAIWVFSFIYFIDFGYFVKFSSEEEIYLFTLIFIAHDSRFVLG